MNSQEKRSAKWIEPDRFYSVYEVASFLNVGRDSVLRLVKSGKLPALKFPKMGGKGRNVKWMVLGKCLIIFIEQHTGRAA